MSTLRRLREAFDDELLVRTGDGMVPTQRAESLRPRLRGALLELNRALNGLDDFDPGSAQRRFVIAGNDYFSMAVLPALWAQIHTQAPHVRVDVREVDLPRAAQQLESGEVDVAIGIMTGGQVRYASDAPGSTPVR
ncbi:MAG: LysR family transcriptional regulator [bacterium]